MANDELWFTALGPSGAGKTTMLACMYKKFEEILSGSIIADTGTFNTLQASYEKLQAEANSREFEFGIGIENTENLREYAFTIKGSNANIPVRFFDFPGGWMDAAKSQPENYNRVIDIMTRSRVIIVAVSTPYLMEAAERYKKEAHVDNIEQVIKQSFIDSEGSKLILIVPIKCEKYTRNDRDRAKLFSRLEEAFAATLNLANNPSYKDRIAIAAIPIHTVGNATFSRFEKQEDGRLPREIYIKNRSMGFKPKDADQPLRYALSFLLNEFAGGYNTSSLSSIFTRINIRELGDFIRDGMKTEESDGIKIYCGRELITDMPGVVRGNNSVMFRKQEETHSKPDDKPKTRDLGLIVLGMVTAVVGLAALPTVPLLSLGLLAGGGYIFYRGLPK